MIKKLTFIPIAASIMCLGSLALVPSKVMKVSATGEENLERYFLFDENMQYSIKPNVNKQGVTGWVSYEETALPLYVDVVSEKTYHISMLLDGTRYYAKSGSSTSSLDSNIASASTWTITPLGNGKFNIDADSKTKHLGFKDKIVSGQLSRCFGTTSSISSDFNYNLILLSVEDEVEPFVTAISNIDCSTYNPSSNDWNNAKDAFDALPVPVKNYLQTLKCNPDASHSTIEWALSKYDYIVYRHHERLTPFIEDREIKDPTSGNVINYNSNVIESNGLTAIITVVSLITIASVTSLLFFKRKKQVIMH